ncbi:hypothetical protein NIA69_21490 [Gemmiger formicilis]|nr:hypothetical protein [Gemmiger formicilis]
MKVTIQVDAERAAGIVSWMFARKRPAAKAPSLWMPPPATPTAASFIPALKTSCAASCPMPPPRAQLRFWR